MATVRTIYRRGAPAPELAAAMAQPLALSDDEIVAEIRAVAERHQPDEPAYGQAYWNAETRTVYWVSWDGTSVEEHDAAYADFLAIPGVENVEGDAESAGPQGDGWELTYASDAEALRAVLTIAAEPLTTESGEPLDASEQPARVAGAPESLEVDLTSTLRELAASGELADSAALTAALEAVGSAHASSMDTIRTLLLARASGRETTVAPDVLTMAALGVLEKFASRPAPLPAPAPVTHVHVPKHDLSVHVDGPTIAAPPPADVKVDVHLPEQPAPQITVEAARAPEVTVQAPPAPEIRVEVPAQPAPVVYVTAAAPEPRSKVVTVDYDPAGNRQYHIDELERGDE